MKPCQDVSHAGLRAGMRAGTRSGLWAQMAHAIDQLRPRYVVAENVRGLLSARADSNLEPCPWCVGGAADGEPDLRALGCVLADLASLGYDARWIGLRAADVGAPHGRFRIFILATDTRREHGQRWSPAITRRARVRRSSSESERSAEDAAADTERLGLSGWGGVRDVGGATEDRSQEAQQWQRDRDAAHHRGTTTADADVAGLERRLTERQGGNERAARPDSLEPIADTDSDGLESVGRIIALKRDLDRCSGTDIAWGAYEPAIRRWERLLDRHAPSPTVLSEKYLARRARRLAKRDKRPVGMRGSLAPVRHLSPRFVEWMQGLPAGWVTDVLGLSRNAQLKALGNGVVPQQAHAALQLLAGAC